MTRAFLVGALVIALLYAGLEAAGARACVSVLSGTIPADDASIVLGLSYTAARLAFEVVVPVLLLAAALHAVLRRFDRLGNA